MKAASLALFLLISTCIVPQLNATDDSEPREQAKIVLDAVSEGRVGELIRFDVSKSSAESFKWILQPDSIDFETYNDGSRAVFSARRPGNYQFIIACALNGTIDVVIHTIKIEGPPPEPVSDSLKDWVEYWMWDFRYPAFEIEALAMSFEAVAARADELKTPEDWIRATAESNRTALGDSLDAWKPMLKLIGKAIEEKAIAGTMLTPEQHAQVWMEIASALRS